MNSLQSFILSFVYTLLSSSFFSLLVAPSYRSRTPFCYCSLLISCSPAGKIRSFFLGFCNFRSWRSSRKSELIQRLVRSPRRRRRLPSLVKDQEPLPTTIRVKMESKERSDPTWRDPMVERASNVR